MLSHSGLLSYRMRFIHYVSSRPLGRRFNIPPSMYFFLTYVSPPIHCLLTLAFYDQIYSMSHKIYIRFGCAFMVATPSVLIEAEESNRHFADDIFKCIFVNENIWIVNKIPLNCIPWGSIDNSSVLVQIMTWRRTGDKPLSEPMINGLVHRRIHA